MKNSIFTFRVIITTVQSFFSFTIRRLSILNPLPLDISKNEKDLLGKDTVGLIEFVGNEAMLNIQNYCWRFTSSTSYEKESGLIGYETDSLERYFNNKSDYQVDPLENHILSTKFPDNMSFISCFYIVTKNDLTQDGHLSNKFIQDIDRTEINKRGFVLVKHSFIESFLKALNNCVVRENLTGVSFFYRYVNYRSLDDYCNLALPIEKLLASNRDIDLSDIPLDLPECSTDNIYTQSVKMSVLNKPNFFEPQHEGRIGVSFAKPQTTENHISQVTVPQKGSAYLQLNAPSATGFLEFHDNYEEIKKIIFK